MRFEKLQEPLKALMKTLRLMVVDRSLSEGRQWRYASGTIHMRIVLSIILVPLMNILIYETKLRMTAIDLVFVVDLRATIKKKFLKRQPLGKTRLWSVIKSCCAAENIKGLVTKSWVTTHGLRGKSATTLFEACLFDSPVSLRK